MANGDEAPGNGKPVKPATASDRRGAARISAPVIAYWMRGDDQRVELPVRDISASGVFVYTPLPLLPVGEIATLEISDAPTGDAVRLQAEAVRSVPQTNGEGLLGMAFQFYGMNEGSPEHVALSALLSRLLSGAGGERRSYPRVSHRISVHCEGADGVRAILKDLSLGGAGLWLNRPLAVGQTLELALERKGAPPLLLPGKVVSTHWAKPDEPFDQAGMHFDEMDPNKRQELLDYLDSLSRD